MELEFWATTDVGRVRDHNEDNFLVDKRLKLFVVCDGMGGHAAGEVASAICVKVVREVISSGKDAFERLDKDPDNLEIRKAILDLCERAIHEASQRIWLEAQEDSAKRGMGTTCSILLLHDGRGFIGHVGDSRIYLQRQGQIHQITEDHSLLNEMLRLGKLKKGEEHLLPHKNAVTRAVGVNEFVEVDTFEFDVFSGDEFLLCSDGLCGYFKSDDAILNVLSTHDVKEATERCIAFANEAGGKDNITSIVIRVSGEVGKHRDIQQTIEALKSVPFFQYLSYKELVQVVNLAERVELAAGTVMGADRPVRALFVVTQGRFEVRTGGTTMVATKLDHFGEASLIDEDATPFQATALEDSVVLRMQVDRFMELLRHDSELAVKILWNFLRNMTIRLRNVASEVDASEASEHTPARGTLVFEEDFKAPAVPAIEADQTLDIDTNHLRAISEQDAGGGAAVDDDEAPVVDGDVTQIPGLMGASERSPKPVTMRPANSSTEDLDWEGIEALLHDDVSEEDLRKTVRIDDFSQSEATMPSVDRVDRKERRFSGVSGESTAKPTAPKAQVFKKNRLVIGEESSADDDESLADRLRRKREGIKKNIEDVR